MKSARLELSQHKGFSLPWYLKVNGVIVSMVPYKVNNSGFDSQLRLIFSLKIIIINEIQKHSEELLDIPRGKESTEVRITQKWEKEGKTYQKNEEIPG